MIYYSLLNTNDLLILTNIFSVTYNKEHNFLFKYNNVQLKNCGNTALSFIIVVLIKTWWLLPSFSYLFIKKTYKIRNVFLEIMGHSMVYASTKHCKGFIEAIQGLCRNKTMVYKIFFHLSKILSEPHKGACSCLSSYTKIIK